MVLAPRPSTKRPPEMRSRSIAVMAVSKGLRVDAMAMPVPSWIRSVTMAAAARVENGAPCTWVAKRPVRPSSSACRAKLVSRGAGSGTMAPQ